MSTTPLKLFQLGFILDKILTFFFCHIIVPCFDRLGVKRLIQFIPEKHTGLVGNT